MATLSPSLLVAGIGSSLRAVNDRVLVEPGTNQLAAEARCDLHPATTFTLRHADLTAMTRKLGSESATAALPVMLRPHGDLKSRKTTDAISKANLNVVLQLVEKWART